MILLQLHVVSDFPQNFVHFLFFFNLKKKWNWCHPITIYFSWRPEYSTHHQCTEDYDSVLMVTSLSEVATLLPFLFLICYIGENVAKAFNTMNESMYNISWHLWPVELQQYLPAMLMIARQPVYFESIVSLNCSLESFKRVTLDLIFHPKWVVVHPSNVFQIINAGYSVFMILRRFS